MSYPHHKPSQQPQSQFNLNLQAEIHKFLYTFDASIEEQLQVKNDNDNIPTTDSSQPTPHFRIKRRKIKQVPVRKNLRRVANIPKSLIGNFYKYLPAYEDTYTHQEHYLNTHQTIAEWLGPRFDLNLVHLTKLFGGDSLQSYENRVVLRKMIEHQIWKLIGLGTKVENCLTYMVCLQKYAARLANPQLTSRMQI